MRERLRAISDPCGLTDEPLSEDISIATGSILPPPNEPMKVARQLAREHYQLEDGTPTLRHWRGGWWQWQGSHWVEVEQRAARAAAYEFTESRALRDEGRPRRPWSPNRHKIADLLEALAAGVHLPETVEQPCWIDGGDHDGVIVACANGLLDVERRDLLDHTPAVLQRDERCRSTTTRDAVEPARWLAFLRELWGDDPDSIDALQEFFGYVDLRQARPAQDPAARRPDPRRQGRDRADAPALVGPDNVAGPTLSSLGRCAQSGRAWSPAY